MKRKLIDHHLSVTELGRLMRAPTLPDLLDAYKSLEKFVKEMDGASITIKALCEGFFRLVRSAMLEPLVSRVFIETFCNELVLKRVLGLKEAHKTLESSQADAFVDWNSIFKNHCCTTPRFLLLQFKATINRRPFFKMTKHYEGHLIVFVQINKSCEVEVFVVRGNQLAMHQLPYLLMFDISEESVENEIRFGHTVVRLPSKDHCVGSLSDLRSKLVQWESEFTFKANTTECNVIQSPESAMGIWGEQQVLKLLSCLNAAHPIVNQLPFDVFIHHSGKRWTAQIRTMTIPTGRTWIGARLDRGGDRWNVLMAPDYFIFVLVEDSRVIALLVFTRKELLQRRFLYVPKRCTVDGFVAGPNKGTMRFPIPHPKVHGYLRARYASNIILVEYDNDGVPTSDTKRHIETFFLRMNKKLQWLIDQEIKFREISHDFVLPSSTECIKVSIKEIVFNLKAMNCEVQYHDGLEKPHANLEVLLPNGEKFHWMVLGINVDISRRASFQKFEIIDVGFEFKRNHADEVVVAYWSTCLGRLVGLDRFSCRFVQRNNGTLRVKPPTAPKYRNPGNRHAIWVKLF